jgi:hypothetical protein|tara:strand:- start:8797 stop:9171 length:375 start_codon:yes stop_codon:yes gene_type:complete
MERLETILSALLAISIFLNVVGAIYIREAVKRLLSISLELSDLQRMVDSFTRHLQTVYELESFYGDETLRGLLEHANSFNEQMDTFDYFISLTEKEENKPDDTEEDREEPNSAASEPEAPEEKE